MPIDLRVGLLALGALLVVIAVLGGRLLGESVAASLRVALRVGIGVLGIALIAWVLAGYLAARGGSAPSAAAERAAHPLPADLVRLAGTELSACALPSPPELPDGASASREQMSAARQAFEAYDAATNAYTKCVDATVARVASRQGRGAPDVELGRLKAFGTAAHNTAINQEQGVADQLNTQIRAFKAKHPQ